MNEIQTEMTTKTIKSGGDELEQIAAAIRGLSQHAVSGVIQTGLHLIDAKGKCPRGTYQSWVKANLNLERRTAERAMSSAKRFGDVAGDVKTLSCVSLYALAGRETPQSAVDEALTLLRSGQHLSDDDVAALIHRHKHPEQADAAPVTARASARAAEDPQRQMRTLMEDLADVLADGLSGGHRAAVKSIVDVMAACGKRVVGPLPDMARMMGDAARGHSKMIVINAETMAQDAADREEAEAIIKRTRCARHGVTAEVYDAVKKWVADKDQKEQAA